MRSISDVLARGAKEMYAEHSTLTKAFAVASVAMLAAAAIEPAFIRAPQPALLFGLFAFMKGMDR